ncbi:MAG TPA: hypothetical protein GX707_06340 [Epulopiscium sp.]|nr:hypothetical protein [Candidatus Epulonipiscium sp.]
MTLEGFLKVGNSYYGENKAKYMIIYVSVEGNTPEIIINTKENFKAKLNYYTKAYNNDLTLKANSNIKIVKYDFVEELNDYFV